MRLTGNVRPLATPGWTLNLEMFFYVIFSVALPANSASRPPSPRGRAYYFASTASI
jgi:peptidoglycan/LPS O-acetylase OafA/YrhL